MNNENMIGIEIENFHNSHHEDFREVVKKIPYILVAAYSERYDSILATIRVKDANKHKEYFWAIVAVFEKEYDLYIGEASNKELWAFNFQNPLVLNSKATVWEWESKDVSDKNNVEALASAIYSTNNNHN